MSISRRMQMAGARYLSAWDISEAYWPAPAVDYFSVAAQDTDPTGLSFKPDGTKMYVVGAVGDAVYEYDLSTAWDITTASYLQSFSVSTQEANPNGVFFKSDGTKMYVIGTSTDTVLEYDLSTAWDISTASYLQGFSVNAQEAAPRDLFFKSDGTKMYVMGSSGDDVNEYNLSTAWDVSTASYLQNFSVATQETAPQGLFFKSDGLKMYVVGISNSVYEYDLSTAWDVSSASYLQSFSLSTSLQNGIFFKPDGTKMYLSSNGEDAVLSYDLSTAWDVSTAVGPVFPRISLTSYSSSLGGLFFKPDGTKMYFTEFLGNAVVEYDLSTAWSVGTGSYLQSFSTSAQTTRAFGLFFKPDGTKMYVVNYDLGAGNVNEYDLSTAWDITTASYVQTFNLAVYSTGPTDIFFKPDGTKMYVLDGSAHVDEYDLSTAWDISTLSYSQNYATGLSLPAGLFFKPDGAKMYVADFNLDTVSEYDLSTAWDVSSASYVQNFDNSSQQTQTRGLFFRPDGKRMYLISDIPRAVYEYSL